TCELGHSRYSCRQPRSLATKPLAPEPSILRAPLTHRSSFLDGHSLRLASKLLLMRPALDGDSARVAFCEAHRYAPPSCVQYPRCGRFQGVMRTLVSDCRREGKYARATQCRHRHLAP